MIARYIPSPSRGVVHLGPLPLRAYALCIILGVIVAVAITDRRLSRRGYPPGITTDVALWAVPFGVVGGRVYHVLTDPELYFGAGRQPVRALYIWQGGLGIWGAVALGAVGALIGARRHGVDYWALGDALAPALPIAQAIGRWGNYFNQELYGRPSGLPWALRIDVAHRLPGYESVATYQPTFLYEALWDVGVAAVVFAVDRRARRRGVRVGGGRLFALYVAAYTVGRAWIEALRIDTVNHFGPLRLNDYVSIVVFAGAVAVFVRRRGYADDGTVYDEPLVVPAEPAEPEGLGDPASVVAAPAAAAAAAPAAAAVPVALPEMPAALSTGTPDVPQAGVGRTDDGAGTAAPTVPTAPDPGTAPVGGDPIRGVRPEGEQPPGAPQAAEPSAPVPGQSAANEPAVAPPTLTPGAALAVTAVDHGEPPPRPGEVTQPAIAEGDRDPAGLALTPTAEQGAVGGDALAAAAPDSAEARVTHQHEASSGEPGDVPEGALRGDTAAPAVDPAGQESSSTAGEPASPEQQSQELQSPELQSPVQQSPVQQSPVQQSPEQHSPAQQSPAAPDPAQHSPAPPTAAAVGEALHRAGATAGSVDGPQRSATPAGAEVAKVAAAGSVGTSWSHPTAVTAAGSAGGDSHRLPVGTAPAAPVEGATIGSASRAEAGADDAVASGVAAPGIAPGGQPAGAVSTAEGPAHPGGSAESPQRTGHAAAAVAGPAPATAGGADAAAAAGPPARVMPAGTAAGPGSGQTGRDGNDGIDGERST